MSAPPPETWRVFLALPIPPLESLEPVSARLSRLGDAVRVVPAAQRHLTVQFLGETPCDQIEAVVAAARAAASATARFTAQVAGLGVFPRRERPTVVWAGLSPVEPFQELAAWVAAELAPLGFLADPRPFHPHVTLARIKFRPPPELFDVLDRDADTVFGAMEFSQLEIIRSVLTPQGSNYTTIATAELAHGGSAA